MMGERGASASPFTIRWLTSPSPVARIDGRQKTSGGGDGREIYS